MKKNCVRASGCQYPKTCPAEMACRQQQLRKRRAEASRTRIPKDLQARYRQHQQHRQDTEGGAS